MASVLERHGSIAEVMPVYTYKCRSCSSEHDRHHGFDMQVTDLCDCGGDLRRVFNPAGVSFNGEGFYRNDSRQQGKED